MNSFDRARGGDDFALLEAALVRDDHEDLSIELAVTLSIYNDMPNARNLAAMLFVSADAARFPYAMEILAGPYLEPVAA